MKPNGTSAKGYGYPHRKLRKRFDRVVREGKAFCCRCGRAIRPDEAWHLDHAENRQGYNGQLPTAHARCNSLAGAKKGGRATRAKRNGNQWRVERPKQPTCWNLNEYTR